MKLNAIETKELMQKGYTIVVVESESGKKQKYLFFVDKKGNYKHAAIADHGVAWIDSIEFDIESAIACKMEEGAR